MALNTFKTLENNSIPNRNDLRLNAPGGPYDRWLSDMATRPGAVLMPIGFDPKRYPEQQFAQPKVDAHDPYWLLPDQLYYWAFRQKWAKDLGGVAVWDALTRQLSEQPSSSSDSMPLMERTAQLMAAGKNIMVVTSHFSFEELGYFKALRFAERQDRSRMDHIGTVFNKLMARQSLGGKSLIRQFARYSNVYFSYPRTASSQRFEVPEDIMRDGNLLMGRALLKDLRSKSSSGDEVDIALTGRQIIRSMRGDGATVDHYEVPGIDSSSVGLIRLFDYAYGATMIKSPKTGEWELAIGDLIDINERLKVEKKTPESVVDEIYLPIAQSVERITKKRTIYRCLGNQALKA